MCNPGTASQLPFSGCPFSEDALSSKRIFPGPAGNFRGLKTSAKTSKWYSRLVVTDESFSIFLSMVESQHAANQAKRSKLTRATLEEKAEVAAVACALSVEMGRELPGAIAEDVQAWLERFKAGDPGVEMELAGALAEKSESYTVRDNASPQVCA